MDEPTSTFLTAKDELVNIIELIRKLRNDLIKDFLDERNLIPYLSKQYRVMELSGIKLEYIKRDLKDLLISPVDVKYYEPLIQKAKETGVISLSFGGEELFYDEIAAILKKYIY